MKNKAIRYLVFGLGGLVVLLIILKAMGVIGKENLTKIAAEKVSRRDIVETVSATGKIYPVVEVKVSSDVSGEIVELNVKEGDSVRKGQVLARINPDLYNSAVERAQASVKQSQASVGNYTAMLSQQKATLDQAELNYKRFKQLYKDKVVSASEFEQAETQFKTSQANYNAAKENISGGRFGVESSEAALREANQNLRRTTIFASMDGVVSLMAVEKGERVVGTAQMTGTEMLRIADLNSMEARVDVGENDIQKVSLGDTAYIQVDAYGDRKFKGIVTEIANSSTNATATAVANSDQVTNYTVKVRLLHESYSDLLGSKDKFPFKPSMSARVQIRTKRKAGIMAVPINAVTIRENLDTAGKHKTKTEVSQDHNKVEDEPKEMVFIYNGTDKKVYTRVVKTGIQDDNYIEITEGLKESEEVVTAPYSAVSRELKNGTKVEKVDKDKLFETPAQK
jgi:HlyD family secretion protein